MSDIPTSNRFLPIDPDAAPAPGMRGKLLTVTLENGEIVAYDPYDGASNVSSPLAAPPGLSTTTREELASISSPEAAPAQAGFTPAHGGRVRGREDTPSADAEFSQRRSLVNASNNAPGSHAASTTRPIYAFGSTKQITSITAGNQTDPDRTVKINGSNAPDAYTIQRSYPVSAVRSTLDGAGATAPAQPVARATRHEPGVAGATILVPDSQASQPTQLFKMEPEERFQQRTANGLHRRHAATRSDAPSPPSPVVIARTTTGEDEASFFAPQTAAPTSRAPSATSHAPSLPAAQPIISSQAPTARAAPPRSHAQPVQPAQDADQLMDDDDLYEQAPPPPPAQQPAPAPAALEVRNRGVYRDDPVATERERAANEKIADELYYSSLPVRAAGDNSPLAGALANDPARGIGEAARAHWDAKAGKKVIVHVHNIYNRLATTFSTDEIIAMLNFVSDRVFLGSLQNYINWSHLFNPHAAQGLPRVRPCTFIGHGLTDRQEEILTSRRFWSFGTTDVIVHRWNEQRSPYVYSFYGVRNDDSEFILALIIAAILACPTIRAIILRQIEESRSHETVDDMLAAITDNISVDFIDVAQNGTTFVSRQYNVNANVDILFSDEELVNFTNALRSLNIEHVEFGRAIVTRWNCRICHALTHPAGMCAARLVLGWRIDFPATGGNGGHGGNGGGHGGNGGGNGGNGGNGGKGGFGANGGNGNRGNDRRGGFNNRAF